MSFTISYIFEAVDEFSPIARKISSSFSGLTGKANKLSSRLKLTSESLTKVGMAAGVRLNAAIDSIGIVSIKTAADIQKWGAQWDVFTKSHKKSQAILEDIFKISTKFGISFAEANQGMVRMAAGREPLKYLHDDLLAMANISALTGISMTVLGTNWAKVAAAGRTFGQELMELRRIGLAVPAAFQALAKQYHLTGVSLREESQKGLVSANDYRKIMYEMGFASQFYGGGMARMARTLSGAFRITRADIFKLRYEIGEQIAQTTELQKRMETLNMAMSAFAAYVPVWVKTHQATAVTAIEIGIILSLLSPVLITLGQIAWAVWGISKAFGIVLVLIRSIVAVAMFLFLTPLGLITLAIAGITTGVVLLLRHFFTWKQLLHDAHIMLQSMILPLKVFLRLIGLISKAIIYPFKEMAHIVGVILSPIKDLFRIIEIIAKAIIYPIKQVGAVIIKIISPLKIVKELFCGIYSVIKHIVATIDKIIHPIRTLKESIKGAIIEKPIEIAHKIAKKPIEIARKITEHVTIFPKIDTGFLAELSPIKAIKGLFNEVYSIVKHIVSTFNKIIHPVRTLKELMRHEFIRKPVEMTHKIVKQATIVPKIDTTFLKTLTPMRLQPAIPSTVNVAHSVKYSPVSAQPMAMQPAQSNLAISVYDPGRHIKTISGESTGHMTLDTGTNMALSRI